MTEEELDAAVDVIAAVDAGVLQSLNQRIKQRNKTSTSEVPGYSTHRNSDMKKEHRKDDEMGDHVSVY